MRGKHVLGEQHNYYCGVKADGRPSRHIKTLNTRDLKESMKKGGCGECQTSCQSACKTSCTVGNQSCEKEIDKG